MKFLLDQGLPRSTVQHLQAIRLDAEHVGPLGLAAARDEAILNEGRLRNAVIITLDADFHAILAPTRAAMPSVVRIRRQGLNGEGMARLLGQVLRAVESDLLAGAAVTVTDGRLALRRLPLFSKDAIKPIQDDIQGN